MFGVRNDYSYNIHAVHTYMSHLSLLIVVLVVVVYLRLEIHRSHMAVVKMCFICPKYENKYFVLIMNIH